MSRTIASSYASAVTLGGGDNPLSITGTIDAATGGNAVYGGPASQWTVTNSGVIEARAASANGVALAGGGTVVNQANATIGTGSTADALGAAILIGTASASAPGYLDNFGLITSRDTLAAPTGQDGSPAITNAGIIVGLHYAVALDSSGTVSNQLHGVIQGGQGGVSVTDANGSSAANYVLNAGTIVSAYATSAPGYGVFMDSGRLANEDRISGFRYGVGFAGVGSLVNSGTITGDTGVRLNAGGFVFNEAVIIGTTHEGISALGPATVTNAGTIAALGAADVALTLDGGRLIIERGSVFDGVVDGDLGTLELTPDIGTIAGLGRDFQSFSAVQFDAGANATVTGETAAIANLMISGFRYGDSIVIDQANESVAGLSDGTLTLTGSATMLLFVGTLYVAEASGYRTAPDGSGNTDLTVACFAAGTRILTPAGEVPVDELRPGMRVVSLSHRRAMPVRWVGRQRSRVPPVRIAPGAFGAGVPHRALLLSPDHAVRVAGALVPVRHLLNGASIAPLPPGEVEYVHVELAEHAVLLADGLPAESFLDTGNRAAFTPHPWLWQPNSDRYLQSR